MSIMSAFALLFAALAAVRGEDASPVARVIGLLDDLTSKVQEEGKAEDARMKEYAELCEKRASDLGYEIRTAKSDIEELAAKIEKASGKIESFSSSIQEIQKSIASSESDLSAAQEVRKKENADFKLAQKDLLDTQATIETAMQKLEVEEKKGGASLLQVSDFGSNAAVQAIQTMLEASVIGHQDAKTLTAFLQNSQQDTDLQPPKPVAYVKKNGAVTDLLQDMLDKSHDELSELRKKETAARNSFEKVVQGLQDAVKYSKQDLEKKNKMLLDEQKIKADAEKELQETQASLKVDEKTLADSKADCKEETAIWKEESRSRALETDALAETRRALVESMPGAAPSFLQLGQKSSSSSKLRHIEVVKMIRSLSQEVDDHQLLLLSRRMDSMLRSQSSSGADVFTKIKKLIQEMITTMEKNLQEETSKKQYCDTENAKNKDKQDEKQGEIDDVTAKIDKAASKSTSLKNEVKHIKEELATLAETKANMTKLRQEEKEFYDKNEPETEKSLEGVKIAVNIMRDFYKKSGVKVTSGERKGAAGGIIGRLEDCEADFAMSLSEMRSAEKIAAKDYEKDMEDMKIEKIQKDKDVTYKTDEARRLDADVEELNTDREGLNTEMGAILEYQKGLDAECIVTPETFAEKQAKKQKEIDGLNDALVALDSASTSATPEVEPTAFLQRSTRLRGQRQQYLGL
eukprot:TRINITY_DN4271_c0_g1_i1.p1 TRINITY_DN4271_c0_g1~~TRINITY_DN4271_c0_g1_i1.p1  ORF type:complete len:690 (-),score=241.54 TRINITY_DN4271_c0_g1_i1:67-2136(-)